MSRHVRSSAVLYHASPPAAVAAVSSDATTVRAKLFANGRSQAVRLPKEFRMPGTEVLIWRDGDRVVLEPIPEVQRDANGWPIGFWDEMRRLREEVDLDDFQIPDDPVPPPIIPWDAE